MSHHNNMTTFIMMINFFMLTGAYQKNIWVGACQQYFKAECSLFNNVSINKFNINDTRLQLRLALELNKKINK
jgi:hypothetical protein